MLPQPTWRSLARRTWPAPQFWLAVLTVAGVQLPSGQSAAQDLSDIPPAVSRPLKVWDDIPEEDQDTAAAADSDSVERGASRADDPSDVDDGELQADVAVAASANDELSESGELANEAAEPGAGPRLGEAKVQRLRVGVEIASQGSPCRGVLATLPIPADWPEQTVRVVEEDISPNIRNVTYRDLDGQVKQMVVQIPVLDVGETARAILVLEVRRRAWLEPAEPQSLVLPARPDRQVRPYLSASPMIESRHPKIRQVADELERPESNAWDQVEVIYDYVRDHVEYREGELKGAVAALRDGNGDCEEMTSLFVALCRANKIPARMVWVVDHCYPEFYLEDTEGRGYWIPCQAAGTRAFGSMPDLRPILQKGDNIFVPEKRSRERYVSEFLKVASLRGRPPSVRFVREYAPLP